MRASVTLGAKNCYIADNGPDIGDYEAAQELPIYGPRPAGVDEETQYIRHAESAGMRTKIIPWP